MASELAWSSSRPVTVQRKCACAGSCAPCRKETLQRQVHVAIPGAPVKAASRNFGARFRHDFGSVRVHADNEAARPAAERGPARERI